MACYGVFSTIGRWVFNHGQSKLVFEIGTLNIAVKVVLRAAYLVTIGRFLVNPQYFGCWKGCKISFPLPPPSMMIILWISSREHFIIRNNTCLLNWIEIIQFIQRFAAAEEDCCASLTLDPLYIKAYLRRGTARLGLEKCEEAKADFEKVLKLEPQNKQASLELEKIRKVVN